MVGDLIRGVLLGESVCLALNSPTQLRENHISGSMVDKRLIFCMDLPDGRFDPATVGILKQMTGDPNNMTANRKHVQQQSFKSRCKILFSSNFIVQLKGGRQDEAFFDRMICVPFFNSVPKDARDINLLEKMKLEKGYIFQQAMAALRDLRGRNFVLPKSTSRCSTLHVRKQNIDSAGEQRNSGAGVCQWMLPNRSLGKRYFLQICMVRMRGFVRRKDTPLLQTVPSALSFASYIRSLVMQDAV